MLADGLREREHEVTLLVASQDDPSSLVEVLSQAADGPSIRSKIIHRLGVNQLRLLSLFPDQSDEDFFKQFDLIHFHDVPFLNWGRLAWLCELVPVYWTMHTMAAFTGNCLYSFGCERFHQSCGRCPEFGKFPLNFLHRDGSRLAMMFKKNVAKKIPPHRLFCVGVSDWISARCREGFLGKFQVKTILNSVNTEAFHPHDKMESRRELGIPEDAKVILFSVAGNQQDKRKGLDVILTAIPKLRSENLFFVPLSIGPVGELLSEAMEEGKMRMLPPTHVDSEALLAKYYSAADVVWHPSRADTSSLVSLEALSCNAMVIAARVGGVPEVVRSGGILIPPNDPAALADATDVFFREGSSSQVWDYDGRIERLIDEHLAFYSLSQN